MKSSVLIAASVSLCLLAPTALAQSKRDDTVLRVGLRTGVAAPFGTAPDKITFFVHPGYSRKLNDQFLGMVPFWLDLGVMVSPNVFAGLYAQYGYVFIRSFDRSSQAGCPTGASCHATDLRVGLQAQYHFSPSQEINPWFGLGAGYEQVHAVISAPDVEYTKDFGGFEIVNFQGGTDFALSDDVAVGPFLSFSIGHYQTRAAQENNGLHEWLLIGVKASLPR